MIRVHHTMPLPSNKGLTARQIIERRLGRDLGPLETMPKDLRRALYLLGLALVKTKLEQKPC